VAGSPSIPTVESRRNLFVVIGASSAGTLIEWYDFYIFGALAPIIATHFFPKDNPTAAFLATLATFAAGFVVRPFGALFFGRLGDVVGRKYTFLVTLLLMGGATFAMGLVPGYETIGLAAPLVVLVLRLLQGLALGGEYGGAATYVAEHSPEGRRGFFTGWIQTTATLGLFVSLGVILGCRQGLGEEAFADWGWRIPFLLSVVLVGLSYLLRRRLQESPLFQRVKSSGKASANPLRDSFTNPSNLRLVVLALLGATAGQGVVWYTGQFYALTFLQKSLNVEMADTNIIVACALLAATPLFIFFGGLSDRIGRKPIMMSGCVLAALCYIPLYNAMARAVDTTGCVAVAGTGRDQLPDVIDSEGNRVAVLRVTVPFTNGMIKTTTTTTTTPPEAGAEPTVTNKVVVRPGFRVGAWLATLIFIQMLFVTMVYGPIAAFLVELFPTRIRYTSMSLPYHVGNGVFGGLVPFVAVWLAASPFAHADGPLARLTGGSMFVGLLYPVAIALLTAIIGIIWLPETNSRVLDAD